MKYPIEGRRECVWIHYCNSKREARYEGNTMHENGMNSEREREIKSILLKITHSTVPLNSIQFCFKE